MKYTTFDKMTETQKQAYNELSFEEQLNYDAKLLNQEVKAYVKEYNRLLAKHQYTHRITVEDVTSKPYFYDDESDTLIYSGGKHMAQYNGYNGGLWSEDEVKMWD